MGIRVQPQHETGSCVESHHQYLVCYRGLYFKRHVRQLWWKSYGWLWYILCFCVAIIVTVTDGSLKIGANGLQGLRLFEPCTNGACDIFENTRRVRLTSARWYPSSVRSQQMLGLIIQAQSFRLSYRFALKMDR
jgi:hypothetical protein